MSGPSSQSSPSQPRSTMSSSRKRAKLRSTSVSSMRKMKRPPDFRAHKWLKNAVRAFPKCKDPVGLGANRVMTGNDIAEDCTYSSRISNMKQLLLVLGLLIGTVLQTGVAADSPTAPPAPASPAAGGPVQVQVVTSLGN